MMSYDGAISNEPILELDYLRPMTPKRFFKYKFGISRPKAGIRVVGKGSWKEREVGKF